MAEKIVTLVSVLITGIVSLGSVYFNIDSQKKILVLTQEHEVKMAQFKASSQHRRENCQKLDSILEALTVAVDKVNNNEPLNTSEFVAAFKSVGFLNDQEMGSGAKTPEELYVEAIKAVARQYASCVKNA